MLKGISFRVSQTFDSKILYHITRCLVDKTYVCHIVDEQSEVWANSQGDYFFQSNCYSMSEFYNLVSQKHYAVFLKLQMYIEPSIYDNIHTYDEFQKSDCQLLLLIYDCDFVEIYIKDRNLIEKFYKSVKESGYEDVEYITDDNDTRVKLDVL